MFDGFNNPAYDEARAPVDGRPELHPANRLKTRQKAEKCPSPWQKTGVFADFYPEIANPFYSAFLVPRGLPQGGQKRNVGVSDFKLQGAETSL